MAQLERDKREAEEEFAETREETVHQAIGGLGGFADAGGIVGYLAFVGPDYNVPFGVSLGMQNSAAPLLFSGGFGSLATNVNLLSTEPSNQEFDVWVFEANSMHNLFTLNFLQPYIGFNVSSVSTDFDDGSLLGGTQTDVKLGLNTGVMLWLGSVAIQYGYSNVGGSGGFEVGFLIQGG